MPLDITFAFILEGIPKKSVLLQDRKHDKLNEFVGFKSGQSQTLEGTIDYQTPPPTTPSETGVQPHWTGGASCTSNVCMLFSTAASGSICKHVPPVGRKVVKPFVKP